MIDLRSDTVTLPSDAMRGAIASAELGDDVLGEDPTVIALEEKVSSLFGKEAALFTASGVMANAIAIQVHTQPGSEVIVEELSHVFTFEAGAHSAFAGVQQRTISTHDGSFTADEVERNIRQANIHLPPTALVCMENTHNARGGTVFPFDRMEEIRELTLRRSIGLHLDGARIWNAAAATGVSLDRYGSVVDSLACCFSKGLGAPVGSCLVGDRDFIDLGRRYRKMLGGGMRQAGVLAAAAIHALDHNLERLPEDHRHARSLATALSRIPRIIIDPKSVTTNIVIADLSDHPLADDDVIEKLEGAGLLASLIGDRRLRLVTHLGVTGEQIDEAAAILEAELS